MLYWAYGSNLCPQGMKSRAPGAKRVGPCVLGNGSLVFRGVADVASMDGDEYTIQGGVWRITKTDEQALDRYEGVSGGLYLKRYLTLKVKGVAEECLFYQMPSKRGHAIMPPSDSYLRTIQRGYEYFGLDLDELNKAVASSWDDKNKTEWLRERYVRRGRQKLAPRA